MKVTKFNSLFPPSFVRTEEFTNGVMGSWVILNDNEIKLSDGDYLIRDGDSLVDVITNAEYQLGGDRVIKEAIGKELIANIWKTLSQSGLTDIQSADILNAISVTLIALLAGEVKAARIIANNTPTTANFTTARKSFLLGLIDTAITQL